MEEEKIIVKERCLFLYRKKILELYIKINLIYCLMASKDMENFEFVFVERVE